MCFMFQSFLVISYLLVTLQHGKGKCGSTTLIHFGRLVILFHKLLLPLIIPQKLIKYNYDTDGWDTHLSFSWKKCFLHCLAWDFHCQVNEFVKHHHVPFPIRNGFFFSPFSLIPLDVPSRIPNISSSR